MQNITIIKGDLIELANAGNFNIIVHGCNCHCRMKSGIAKAISERFPNNADLDATTKTGDINKLGTYNYVEYTMPFSYSVEHWRSTLFVINAYTQYNYGYDGELYFNYEAFRKICKKLNDEFKGKIIGMPWIGCGLAGGSKEEVLKIIEEELKDCTIIICEL